MHAAVAGGAARCFSRLARPSADRTKLLAAAAHPPPLARPTVQHSVRAQVRGSSHATSTAAAAEGLGSGGTVEGAETENWHRGGGLVHRLARVDATAVVEAGAVVHAHALVGPNVRIGSGCVVGSGVTIGPSTVLGFNVSLQNCSIGDSCILHNGVCVGQDGFGFFVNEEGEVVKKPQLLRVRIGNHVEIGANSCVDRGSWRDTVIGEYTKIDNLVQVGHNVEIGRCCMLCGQVGVGGSATIGDYVVLGGQAGVADHRTIVSNVRVAAKSGVTTSINEPGDYGGFPAIKAAEFRRALVAFKRLGRPASSKPDC